EDGIRDRNVTGVQTLCSSDLGSASCSIRAAISDSPSRARSPTTSLPSAGTEICISSSMTTRSTYSRSVPRTVRVRSATMRTGPWTGGVRTSSIWGAGLSTDAVATGKGSSLVTCAPAVPRPWWGRSGCGRHDTDPGGARIHGGLGTARVPLDLQEQGGGTYDGAPPFSHGSDNISRA